MKNIKYILLTISVLVLLFLSVSSCTQLNTESQLIPVTEYTINEDGTVKCIVNSSEDGVLYFPQNSIYWHNGSTVVVKLTYKDKPNIVMRCLYINKYEYDKYYKPTKHEPITVKDR